ncbi:MAG: hypothetical protein AB7E24_24505, partial [Novosphingobium sp.]
MPTPFPELETYLPGARQPRQPTTSTAPSTWLDQEMQRQRNESLRDSLLSSASPDAVARTEKVARDTGSNVLDVQGNEDAAERGLQVRQMVDLADRYPAVGRWAATNPRGAAMAADDQKSLGILGTAWDAISKMPARIWKSGVPYTASAMSRVAQTQLEDMAAPSTLDLMRMTASDLTGWDWIAPSTGPTELPARVMGVIGDALEKKSEEGDAATRGANYISEGILQGGKSVPMTAIALLTKDPKLGAMTIGQMTYASSYQEARAKGLSPIEARTYGAAQGTIEGATELMPLGTLGDLITRKLKFGRGAVREVWQEFMGENVATAGQDFVDWAMLPENKNQTFSDYLEARPEAALQTSLAVLGGTATTVGTIGAANKGVDVAIKIGEARQAKRDRAIVDQMAKGAASSKLKQRDPESFRALMREQAETAGATSVFIPGEAIAAYNQSEAYDPDNDPLARPDAEEAALTGSDVVMPIEDFLTDVVGTPAFDAVKEDVRLTQGGMSAREAQTFEEAMADVIGQAADDLARSEQADRSAKTVREQLVDRMTAMFGEGYTAPVARQYAEIAVQRAQTRAQRLGTELTPQDLDRLAVRQILPEGVAQAAAADRLDLVINALRTGANPRYGIGPTLLAFIRGRGGINDVGGDLAAIGVPSRYLRDYVPRSVELTGGVSGEGDYGIDSTLRAAIAAGYFPDLANVETEQGPSTLDTQRLLDAIAEELAGRPAYVDVRTDDVRASAEDLRQTLEEAGYSPANMTDEDIRSAVERMSAPSEGGQSYDQTERGRTVFTHTGTIIELFKARDLSTPIHELGHVWLEELRADAALPEAPEQLRADWDIVRSWFAHSGHAI